MSTAEIKPKERPILFSGPMVRAILRGHKTVTRRIVDPKKFSGWDWSDHPEDKANGYPFVEDEYGVSHSALSLCPYGKSGDILWVRETWQDDGREFRYRATDFGECPGYIRPLVIKWRPSIFMPRVACRLTLRVTDVRVERLQDITEAQAIAEGVDEFSYAKAGLNFDLGKHQQTRDPLQAYQWLWDDINAKRGYPFDSNPWVWVVEFERIMEEG